MSAASRRARLNDPGEHFPYKEEAARAALAENAPAGPEGPDDDRATVADYISEDIITASKALVDAQSQWLASPTEESQRILSAAEAELVQARRAHRTNRGSVPNVVAVRSPL